MNRSFGPAATEREGEPLKVSCVTSQTFCFLLVGGACTDTKPPRPVPDPAVTPDWCKYRRQIEQDVADAAEFRAMCLDTLTRAELSALMRDYPARFRGCPYGTEKPWRLTQMNAEMLRHAIRNARKAATGTDDAANGRAD